MITREAIYKTALEHIRDGSDAVCAECGWMGYLNDIIYQAHCDGLPSFVCPECGTTKIGAGADEIAAYALAQGERGE
jgi:hypothetical protein